MRKTVKIMIPFIAIARFLFCDSSINDPAICGEVNPNAAIHRIGYNASDSMLSFCFINSLSYCTPGFPYETSRLDVSLKDFEYTYTSNRVENQQLLPLPQGSQALFNGEIACYDSCRIPLPIALPGLSIEYIKRMTGDIMIKIDTNGTKAGEFKIWDFK